jgi:hypothetical protein
MIYGTHKTGNNKKIKLVITAALTSIMAITNRVKAQF